MTNESTSINILNDMAVMINEFQKPMTLEEAVRIIDPESEYSDKETRDVINNQAKYNARLFMARKMLVERIRKNKVRIGRWEKIENQGNGCSYCKRLHQDDFYNYDYCSVCGAYMENGITHERYDKGD